MEGFDAIDHIAGRLIQGGTRLERQLLSKSLQETLFFTLGCNTDLSYSEVVKRLRQRLVRHGSGRILQRFLSFHFFSVVWFHTGESFRGIASSSAAFEKDMKTVERLCKRAVELGWKLSQFKDHPADPTRAGKLIRTIEGHLRAGIA